MIIQSQRKKLRKLTKKAAGNLQLLSGCKFEYRDGRSLNLCGISQGRKRLRSNGYYSKPWIAVFSFRGEQAQVNPSVLHGCRYAALLRPATAAEKQEIDRPASDNLPTLEMLTASKANCCRITLVPTGVKSAYVPLI